MSNNMGKEYIKDLLKRKGLTQQELADLLQVNKKFIPNVLYNASKVPEDILEKLGEIDKSIPDISTILNGLSFGEYIQDFRRRKNLSVKNLAELLDVSTTAVNLWENGNEKPLGMHIRKMVKLDASLVDIEILLGGLSPSAYIKKLRHEKALTGKELAQLLNVSAGVVYYWEMGKSIPPNDYIDKLVSLNQELDTKENCEIIEDIPSFIRYYLSEKGYTQSEFACKLGVSKQLVNYWLSGRRRPQGETLEKINELKNELDSNNLDLKDPTDYFEGKTAAQFILSVRQKKGLTQSLLAKILGIPNNTLHYWEKGDSIPSNLILRKIIEIDNTLPNCIESTLDCPVSQYIKDLRMKLGLSQKSLAELLNVNVSSIYFWENNKGKPSNEILAQILKIKHDLTAPEFFESTSSEEAVEILTLCDWLRVKTPFENPVFKDIANLLPEYCKKATILRLGLYDGNIYSIPAISEILGMSEEEVLKLTLDGLHYFETWSISYFVQRDNVLAREKRF